MRFLAVDDDPAVLEIISQLMERDGRHRVETVVSPLAALQRAEAAPRAFDAFLLDIQMPDMTGIELCSALRAIEPLRQTPIVMVTRMSERHFIEDAFAAGATDYMNKPIDLLEWTSRIRMVERLHEERRRALALARQVRSADLQAQLPVEFDAPITLNCQDVAIEYMAIENYLRTLDSRGLFAHATMGIHVENALHIYRRASPSAFVEAMGDVATSIFEGLDAPGHMFAYAGAGDFVVVMPRHVPIDREGLERQVNRSMAEFEPIYAVDGFPTPRVRVGDQIRGSLFGKRPANALLQQAVCKARETGQPVSPEMIDSSRLRKALKG